jgi:hypothetical protein
MRLDKPGVPQPPSPAAVTGRRLSGLAVFLVLGAVVLAVVLLRAPRSPVATGPDARTIPGDDSGAAAYVEEGRVLAGQSCQGCHLLPAPDDLDRTSWAMFVLPAMAKWVGFSPAEWARDPGGEAVEQAGVTPREQIFDFHQWHAVTSYYLSESPVAPLVPAGKPAVQVGLKGFEVVVPPLRQERPMTTLLRVSARFPGFYVHDANTGKFQLLTPEGRMRATIEMKGPVVDLIESAEGLHLTVIGDLFPSHQHNGRVDFLPHPGRTNGPPRRTLIADLARPTQAAFADLDGDGDEDLAVCSFGHVLGRFSWFERMPSGGFEERVLIQRPGAVRCAIHDFNGDGKPDILVMMAQAREGIYLLWNRGGGRFEEEIVVERIPSWGYTGFELADFNGDGHADILAVNGDNGDASQYRHPGTLKHYHGLRIHLNDGQGRFTEAWFHPMHGAYQARVADFDLDGDLDVAAIAFFPAYLQNMVESFVLLENDGAMRFTPFTFAESIAGRWMVMDAGDVDQDGDLDILLGAFNRSFHDVPEALAAEWRKRGPSVVILRNTARP